VRANFQFKVSRKLELRSVFCYILVLCS